MSAVILKVTAPSGDVWFFDAADKTGCLNVLPSLFLVEKARVVPRQGASEWADLSKLCRNQMLDSAKMEVSADGSIKGNRSEHGYNNWAATMKKAYFQYDDPEKFADNIESEDGIEIESIEFQGHEDWNPEATLSYSFTSRAAVSGDYIYLKPYISKYQDESDFQNPERKIPVEFAYPEVITYNAMITIPDGYTVESLPNLVSIACPCTSGKVVAQCLFDGSRTVNVNFRFTCNNRLVVPERYGELRSFWAELANIYNSTIVLKKL